MPAAIAPITAELLADFRGGKESALETLFRQNFEALVQEATERLSDVVSAQKVVAGAFLETWEHRDQAQSASQLEALLRQAVSSGGAHELRRKAAVHRMADTDGEHRQHASAKHNVAAESVDQIWARIVGELHAEKADPAVRARQLAEHSRHGAAAHLAQVAKPTSPKVAIISGIVILAVVAVPLWYLNKGAETTKAQQALSREDSRPMKSPPGTRGKTTLPDGTELAIGAATEVKLTAHFPEDVRAAQVTGSASFKAPAGKEPLLIKVGNAWVYASGASFIVRSFPDDSGTAMIKATSDSIVVKGAKEERTLTAGATLRVRKDGTFLDLTPDLAMMAFSWVADTFAVQNKPLVEVLSELKKWYGLEIIPRDSLILQRPVSMTASLESSKDAIAAFEKGGAVKVGFEGLAMVVHDAASAPAGKKK